MNELEYYKILGLKIFTSHSIGRLKYLVTHSTPRLQIFATFVSFCTEPAATAACSRIIAWLTLHTVMTAIAIIRIIITRCPIATYNIKTNANTIDAHLMTQNKIKMLLIVSLNRQYGVKILHGQGSTLQIPFSYAFPGHLSPPYCGFGLLHFLKVIFAPPSQGLLHSVSSQGPQFPWTSKNSDVN